MGCWVCTRVVVTGTLTQGQGSDALAEEETMPDGAFAARRQQHSPLRTQRDLLKLVAHLPHVFGTCMHKWP